MTKLRAPLKSWLDTPLPEEQLQRMWRRLGRAQRPRWQWTLFGAGLAFSLCAVVWLGSGWLASLRREGPIRRAGSAQLMAAESITAHHPLELALDDGSHIALASAAQLRVIENNAHALVLQLLRGKSAFDVQPGGPRRWRIECGPASVEVVGTRFDVERDERGVRVSVSRGVVMVRAVALPDGVVRLRAGQSVSVREQPEPPAAAISGERARAVDGAAQPPDTGSTNAGAVGPHASAVTDDTAAPDPRLRRTAAEGVVSRAQAIEAAAIGGKHDSTLHPAFSAGATRPDPTAAGGLPRSEAARRAGAEARPVTAAVSGRQRSAALARLALAPSTVAADAAPASASERVAADGQSARPQSASPADAGTSPTAQLDQWLSEADRARHQHEPDRAKDLLRRVIATAPRGAHAALAAFTLARLQLRDEPAAAAASLELAMTSALPEGLREDALALEVEARARAGQRERARAAARRYVEHYPQGRHRDAVARWTALR